jgi:hypothetical protein
VSLAAQPYIGSLIAFSSNGTVLWWTRVSPQPKANDGVSVLSRYLHGLSYDYAAKQIVLLGQSLCPNADSGPGFWQGNQVAFNRSATGFLSGFSGDCRNYYISWLGKVDARNGTLQAWYVCYPIIVFDILRPPDFNCKLFSTYVSELDFEEDRFTEMSSNSNLSGWPNPNQKDPRLKYTETTCASSMRVDVQGRVYIICTGKRFVVLPSLSFPFQRKKKH